MSERLNKNNFIPQALKIHGFKYSYDHVIYRGAKVPVTITCGKHGDFTQRPLDHILKKCGCPKCKTDKVIKRCTYTQELFLLLAYEIHGIRYDYSKVMYKHNQKPVTIICPIHGEFQLKPRNHIVGHGCPKCGRIKANQTESYTLKQFIGKAEEVHGKSYDYRYVLYNKSTTKIPIICSKHGVFYQRPVAHLLGLGCPKCRLRSQFKLYTRLVKIFPHIEILFEVTSKTLPWLQQLRIDICIPKIKYAIEYNGILHYELIPYFKECTPQRVQKYMELKQIKCIQNGYILKEIKYNYSETDFKELLEEIQNLLKKELIESMEEFTKKYYAKEATKEEKEQLALDAGITLVNEILYNTVDKTNKLL